MKWLTALVLSLVLAPALQAADIPANIAAAVAAPERSAKDRERDARDKPAELLAFAGVRAGDKVADVFGGGATGANPRARGRPVRQWTLVNNDGYFISPRTTSKRASAGTAGSRK